MQVSAYKSLKKQELYLFVPTENDIKNLPNELIVMFGEPQHVIDFELTADRALARANPAEVKTALESKGYFIQMPPSEAEIMGDMPPPPEHLDNIF